MPLLISIPTLLSILFFLFLCIELKGLLKRFSIPLVIFNQVLKIIDKKHRAIKPVIFMQQTPEQKNNSMKSEFIPVLILQDSIYLVN
jgi:hypothetical protein